MKVATELFRRASIVFWDPQAGEVITETKHSLDSFEYGLTKTQEIRERYSKNSGAKKPWWKVW